MMDAERYDLIEDNEYGFFRLDPIPSDETLSEFYQSEYPELLENGELAADVSRLLRDDDEAKRERIWRRSTWYADHMDIIEREFPNCHRILDVGCGTGEFISFVMDQGYDAVGIEPSGRIGDTAREKGFDVHETTVEKYAESQNTNFDLITMFNVLEHVPNPIEVLEACRELLIDDGMLIVKVPNEFNPFQMAARAALNLGTWWVDPPTHIFYFNFDSLAKLLSDLGFEVQARFADFPMSQFLLMGHNYVENDEMGRDCHDQRVRFELAIDDDHRRMFYSSLASVGLGRNCTLFATAE
ncbi:class I SAM-dependent methyltransferase [Halosimplex rubrum]|uniref:Class I SAM-dependent methyltransferase n=1 Tax=Halosimplex rubrum TaxID=869889 RepID=A0A7D5P2Z9_9EURY|nr:class I SAM-dependent methyltransferase [Halosimplex rubrum]QLH76824.1 class I SAM-dependent methyltransferase [Halosimplex rubrum]